MLTGCRLVDCSLESKYNFISETFSDMYDRRLSIQIFANTILRCLHFTSVFYITKHLSKCLNRKIDII